MSEQKDRILKIVRKYPNCKFNTIWKKMPDVPRPTIHTHIRPLVNSGKLVRHRADYRQHYTYRVNK